MSHFYTDIHEARIDEAYNRLSHMVVAERAPLTAEVAVTPEPVPYEKRLGLKYRSIAMGEKWGGTWDCAWFHVRGRVPASWRGCHVTLNADFGGEALVFGRDGAPAVGLTNGSVFDANYNKDHWHFLDRAKGGEAVDLWIDAACNGLFGVNKPDDPAWEPDPARHHGHYSGVVVALSLCRFDYDAWQLRLDIEVLRSMYSTMPKESGRRIRLVRAVSKALDCLPEERGGARAVREKLAETAFAMGPDPASIHVTAIGHAHIDTAWLWPLRETVRKVARTWSSQIGLIARYPGYKFGASQAQLYAYCKEHYPRLFAKVRKAVAAGDWELQGGMWVEADCNIPSGESLIRQFCEGGRFFREEFGSSPRNLWLPDVFGYSGNLPQIMKICGIDFFLTQKLSWNRYNRFPHNTFVWQGIDGSRVVAHFPPEDTYNADMLPASLMRHETNNREAGIVNEAVSLFGIGDGGGGPKEEYVERGLRVHALNGCPRVDFGFASDALARMAKLAPELDTWVGELYFEMHRGTLTTQAAQKKANRRAEEALRAAEAFAAAASSAGRRAYPRAEFQRLWRDLLLCQFHDIIPGSSIARVYDECGEIVRNVARDAARISDAAGRSLLKPDSSAVTFFNPSSTHYSEVVALPGGWRGAEAPDGTAVPAQREPDGAVVARIEVAGNSFATYRKCDAAPSETRVRKLGKGTAVLENECVRYEIDASMRVVSALDKATGRVFITPDAPANELALFDDHPPVYDAWDFEEYAAGMKVAGPAGVVRTLRVGPVRTSVAAEFTLGGSKFRQTASLAAGSARLDFRTSVDWTERHRLCRVAFPVGVSSDEASFEIQYGVVRRSTNDNTKWQYAQFECVGHRFADISDPDFGVALLNDCKYGYRAKGRELSLTLLRSPTNPDPFADIGTHEFTYSLLPHAGTLDRTDAVVAAAAAINQGVVAFGGAAAGPRSRMPVSVSGDGVELAVVKVADDGGDLVVRLVERRGRRAVARLETIWEGAEAIPCLATETAATGAPIPLPAEIPLGQFQILTLRVRRRGNS